MLTPLDIENKRFPTKFKGYDDAAVDDFLDQVTVDYERLYNKYSAVINKYKNDAIKVGHFE